MKITADTTVLVRAITEDHESQSKAAQSALKRAELVAISVAALCELVWVLSQGYKVSSKDIATTIRQLMDGENVELTGKLNYADVGDFGNGIGVNLGGVYHVNETFGITAGYDYADRGDIDLNSWNVGARVSF